MLVQGESVWTVGALCRHRVRQRVRHGDDQLRQRLQLLACFGGGEHTTGRTKGCGQEAVNTRRRVAVLVRDASHEHKAKQLRVRDVSIET